MSTLNCNSGGEYDSYPVLPFLVTRCVEPTPSATNTVTPTPTVTSTSLSLNNRECVTPTPTPSKQDTLTYAPIGITPTPSNTSTTFKTTENFQTVYVDSYPIVSHTPTSTLPPTPTIYSNILQEFKIIFTASIFTELQIYVSLYNKTIKVYHSIDGDLPLTPINVAWTYKQNNVLLKSRDEPWDTPWVLVPENITNPINNYYANNILKQNYKPSALTQWSNIKNINSYIPLTDNVNLSNVNIPSYIKEGTVYIDTLPSADNLYTTIVKASNYTPFRVSQSDQWSFALTVTM